VQPAFPSSLSCVPTHDGITAAGSFWDCLSADQKRLFRAKAHNRVFAAGARLMREGDEAGNVAVILSGLTEIRVGEDGGERVIAERGPGQLIGERAALEVNVRSATVVALQTVVALVMRTADFAAFIGTYPAVLKIVEEQIYLRLRERPLTETGAAGKLVTGAAAPRLALTGQNCTVVRTDVVRFNADERDGVAQKIIRRETLAMTRLALGPLWDSCRWEDRGDGLLVIVAPDIPTAQVLERLMTGLPPRLKRHNRTHSDFCRIQLRVAAEVGPIEEDEPGVCGPSINHVSRLVEAPAFKQAIDDQGALLGLIVSPYVYQAHVRPGGSFLDPADFTEIPVRVKETDAIGWIRLTGGSGGG
jgi:CRP-like cAMP-binding protein